MIPKIIKIAGTFLRGVIKAFPLGNAIIEGVNNVKGGIIKDVITPAGETVTGTVKSPHSWLSVIVQISVIALIIYAVYSGKVDVAQAITWLQSF